MFKIHVHVNVGNCTFVTWGNGEDGLEIQYAKEKHLLPLGR